MQDGSEATMRVFKDFGATQLPNIRITKLGCVDGSLPKIPIGQIVEGRFISEVKVGESFNLKYGKVIEGGSFEKKNLKGVTYTHWCTSIVQKIISDNTFQTKNSIYKWEKI
jgi:hypothetical protein